MPLKPLPVAVIFNCLLALADTAAAIDGAIDINQARALRGGIGRFDSPEFPITIDQPGLYRLTGNLDTSAQPDALNVTAIEIFASHVTIDLNGFEIRGPAVCVPSGVSPQCDQGMGDGIITLAPTVDVTVKNGVVRGMGNYGVHLNDGFIDRVRAENIFFHGLRVNQGTITRSHASSIDGTGFVVQNGTISDCHAHGNGNGIVVERGTVRDCHSSGNSVYGISLDNGVVDRCTTNDNGFAGIRVTGNAAVLNSNAAGNDLGILMSSGPILGNTIRNNRSYGIQFTGSGSYGQNVLTGNDDGSEVQVLGGTQIGTNLCGSNTTCP